MIESTTTVRVLYTAALAGQIELLPRLFTVIRRERAAAPGPSLLLDLGRSCVPEAWLCEATGGRGMLVAMDAMGYDTFHIGPRDMLYTQPALVNQIRQVIQTPLAAGPWSAPVRRGDLAIHILNAARLGSAAAPTRTALPEPAPDLVIALRYAEASAPGAPGAPGPVPPEPQASWRDPYRLLWLEVSDASHKMANGASLPLLARLDLELRGDSPYIRVVSHTRLTLPPDVVPDATITGVIDFVQAEARYAAQKRGQP